jgi:transposase
VAVDLHRQTLFVVVMTRDGEELRHLRLPNTAAGEEKLLALLAAGDRVVIEATTGAHTWANRLERAGASVFISDPGANRLVGQRGKKTDYRDCRALLKLLRSGELQTVWHADAATRELRYLNGERQYLNKGLVGLKNRLLALLLDQGLRPPQPPWTTEGAAWLAAQELSPRVRGLTLRSLVAIEALTAVKAAHEGEILTEACASDRAQLLMQEVGFGASVAVLLLGEVGDPGRFARSKELVSYAGLDPRVHRSDTHGAAGGLGIAKAGRAALRWLLTEAAWSHVEHGGPEAALFHRLVARGKPVGVAIVAVARKLLVRAFWVLKQGSPLADVDVKRYERKLVKLAAYRPYTEEAQPNNRVWAAERVKALTGAAPALPPARPRPRRRPRARKQEAVAKRGLELLMPTPALAAAGVAVA